MRGNKIFIQALNRATRLALLIFAFVILVGLESGQAFELGKAKKGRMRFSQPWSFIPAFNGGYNKLLEGYDNYDDLGNAGVDLYIEAPRDTPLPTRWQDNFMFRLSADYFPLQVPENVNGLDEDMYSLNGSIIYQLQSLQRGVVQQWVPFLGFGAGLYVDRVELDTPASGKVSGNHNNLGFVASAGIFLPKINIIFPIRLVPEVRYHSVNVPDGKATNLTFQLAISFWPDRQRY